MGLIDQDKIRKIHEKLREVHAAEPSSALIRTRGRIHRVDGYLLDGETGEPELGLETFKVRQDQLPRFGGENRAPPAFSYMLLGTGF
jgi:hypothetical protein